MVMLPPLVACKTLPSSPKLLKPSMFSVLPVPVTMIVPKLSSSPDHRTR